MAQIVTLDQLKKIRSQLDGVVLAGGVFDLLHVGHVNHLKDAKEAGKTLVVHITSDKRVSEKKGPLRPFQPAEERAGIIAAIRYVDYVFIADVPHYDKSILDAVKPDVLFFNTEALSNTIKSYLADIGWHNQIVVSNRAKNHHTSSIVQKIIATKNI
jgi:rfaE bifunctional protein nucleotidyltransferase chain/domain